VSLLSNSTDVSHGSSDLMVRFPSWFHHVLCFSGLWRCHGSHGPSWAWEGRRKIATSDHCFLASSLDLCNASALTKKGNEITCWWQPKWSELLYIIYCIYIYIISIIYIYILYIIHHVSWGPMIKYRSECWMSESLLILKNMSAIRFDPPWMTCLSVGQRWPKTVGEGSINSDKDHSQSLGIQLEVRARNGGPRWPKSGIITSGASECAEANSFTPKGCKK
jgi:hypothetical protein